MGGRSTETRERPGEGGVLGAGVRINHPVHVPTEEGVLTACVGWWPEGKEQNQTAISPECGLRERGPAAQSHQVMSPGQEPLEEVHGTAHLMCRCLNTVLSRLHQEE